MSLAIKPVRTGKVLDPLTRINSDREYAITSGGSQVTYQNITSTSYNDSSFQFTANPPSPGIIVDRKVALKASIRVTIVGEAPVGQKLIQTGYNAPRKNCLSSVMSSIDVTLNNTKSSLNMEDVIHPLSRYNTGAEVRNGELSVGPQMDDQYQRYASGAGTNRNSLGDYGDVSTEIPRGAFPFTSVTNPVGLGIGGGAVTAIVEFDATEFLYLSPFMWGKGDKAGFIGIQNMNFTFNFSNLSRIWSHDTTSGSVFASVTGHFYAQPTLLFKYVTPAIGSVVPDVAVYPFYNVQRYPTMPGAAIAPNGSTTINSSNIQLHSVPRRIYVLARKRKQDRVYTDADCYFRIDGISVNWDNNSGLLASASIQDLFRMCKKNGLNYSYPQFNGLHYNMAGGTDTLFGSVGSVLCIMPGVDIPLKPDEAPGVLGTYQLQMAVTITNINQTETITPELIVITVSEGTWTIMHNQCVSQVGVISKQDVMTSPVLAGVDYNDISDAYGGNFWSGLKKFGENVWKGIKEVASVALPVVKTVAPMLMGLGGRDVPVGGARKKPAKKRGRKPKRRGGQLLGGKMMSRAELAKALMG